LIKNLVDVAQKCPSDKVAIKLTFTLKPTNKKKNGKGQQIVVTHSTHTQN